MTILCIETSTNCCSAAIAINGEAKATRANSQGLTMRANYHCS